MDDDFLRVNRVNLSHSRLVELYRLANAAKPYYDWLESLALRSDPKFGNLDSFLLNATEEQIAAWISLAQASCGGGEVPQVFNGVARPYRPEKALYLFIAWMVRDAPQQRLAPLLTLMSKTGLTREYAERTALTRLIVAYREDLRTFSWEAVREVVADRLEGSRRSLRGRLVETAVRAVVAEVLASAHHDGRWGRFDRVSLAATEVTIDGHSFDVCVEGEIAGRLVARIVMPVKSRETQGGGHANLFTRDIEAAMASLTAHQRETGVETWLVPVIIAENWHPDQIDHIREITDELVFIDANPNAIETLPTDAADRIGTLILRVLGEQSEG